jgi:histidinol-phosphate aminotransferase
MSIDSLIAQLIPEYISRLPIYQPGKPVEELERELGIEGAIKIASNENPLGPSPAAVAAATQALAAANQYPDGSAFRLRRALAAARGVGEDEIVFGAGSNELVYMIVHAVCRPGDEVLTHRYAFISYKLAALSFAARCVEAGVDGDLGCDVDALLGRVTERTRVVFLASPNNPTGAHLSPADLERLIDELPERVLLVLDEAYNEYAEAAADYRSSLGLRDRRPLLLTLRTFSKIHGLAGLRVGYGIGPAPLIAALERVRRPFNVSSVAQAAALAALDDSDHVERSADVARRGIVRLRAGAAEIGVRSYPSLGNFVLVDVERDAGQVYDQLLRRGVIVRPMGAWGLPTCLRISVGTAEQTERAVATLADVLS